MGTMYKNINEIDMGKMMRTITAAYDEQKEMKTAEQLRNHIVQFSNEITDIAQGCSMDDIALIHKKVFETLDQFNKDPTLRFLLK